MNDNAHSCFRKAVTKLSSALKHGLFKLISSCKPASRLQISHARRHVKNQAKHEGLQRIKESEQEVTTMHWKSQTHLSHHLHHHQHLHPHHLSLRFCLVLDQHSESLKHVSNHKVCPGINADNLLYDLHLAFFPTTIL